jgi:glycosyltransferase involved in cell wall biosynthesis
VNPVDHQAISVQMLIDACQTAATPAARLEAAKLLEDSIFQTGKLQEIVRLLEETIQPLLSNRCSEPLLIYHAYGWQYGGAERLITSLANYMARKSYRIVVAVFEPIRNTDYKLDPSISFVPICGDVERIERLLLFIELIRTDVFIGHNNSIPELAGIYPVLRSKGIHSIAYTLEYYFFPHRTPDLVHSIVQRSETLSEASAACFLTRFSANAYRLSRSNAVHMPGPSSFSLPPDNPDKCMGKTVLAVGRFDDPIKRLDRVLLAFKQVLNRHSDAKLLVVGPYNLKARIPIQAGHTIGELLNKLKLPASQIRFVGEQGQTEPYYKEADLFVLTSNNEGFPIVLTEAGTYSLPSVIVDIPGLEDIISEGENGHIVPQDDMQQMGDKIADLFDNPDLLRRMSQKSRELITRYSIEQVGSRWEELIQTIMTHSSQLELDQILAERFMAEVSDKPAFIRRVVLEYEQAAVRIDQSSKPRSDHPHFAAMEISVSKLVNYWRCHGFWKTASKVRSKLKVLLLTRYSRLRRRLRERC